MQLGLALPPPKPGRGGHRKGAGRKPSRPGTRVPHVARPDHKAYNPLHITLRMQPRVANLRGFKLAGAIGRAFRAAALDVARVRRFRVVHFSIQHNHVHLLVEADSRTAIADGMKGLTCRIARAVNRARRSRGAVLGDRYHARPLRTPIEVRHALRYVLQNAAKHADADPIPDLGTAPIDGLDPCSSARWFDGWKRPPPAAADPPVAPARTWLLAAGWRKHGLLRRSETPRG